MEFGWKVSSSLILVFLFIMLLYLVAVLPLVTPVWGAYLEHRQPIATSDSTSVPQYFQTTPEIYAGT